MQLQLGTVHGADKMTVFVKMGLIPRNRQGYKSGVFLISRQTGQIFAMALSQFVCLLVWDLATIPVPTSCLLTVEVARRLLDGVEGGGLTAYSMMGKCLQGAPFRDHSTDWLDCSLLLMPMATQ